MNLKLSTTIVTTKSQRLSLPVMVVLGNPQTGNCSQHGICKMYVQATAPKICPCMHSSNAWLNVSDEGIVKLIFVTQTMSAETRAKFFSGDFFSVQSDFEPAEDLLDLLGLEGIAAVITPGLYPVQQYLGLAEVSFD